MSQSEVNKNNIDEDVVTNDEQIQEEEDVEIIYTADELLSGPEQCETCTIPIDILEFHFSFGYDCRRRYNLVCLDADSLLFASGNYLNFFDVPTRQIRFRRSALGGGIGHIRKNPVEQHFAVAENGPEPLIVLYSWPEMGVVGVLKGGTLNTYTHLDYSPDGQLLASQGGEPDYNITIWDWPKRRILLRTKSYVNDVYRVKFSPYVAGQLVTGGVAHIKNWRMAQTFTGLKLQGAVGRFGKTDYSDIFGVVGMPDEKLASGCNWGNILIWEAGLIKLEVYRTLKRTCHEAPIVKLRYDEDGQLWTIGRDGHIRVWWYEKIDQADPPDDDRTLQMEPTYDFQFPTLMLISTKGRCAHEHDTALYAQDGNGGVWLIDVATDTSPQQSIQLYKCHAGRILDIGISPLDEPYLVSLGEDGRLYLYNYNESQLIFDYQFPVGGGCLQWLPLNISKFGDELLLGFEDGTLRLVLLTTVKPIIELTVVKIWKPHIEKITQMTINQSGTVLVTGSTDKTIFIFKITVTEPVLNLVPIGYIRVPDSVTYLTWNTVHPQKVLIGCEHGYILQTQVPTVPQNYTTISYALKLSVNQLRFTSYKSQIGRDRKLAEIDARKNAKIEEKRKKLDKIKRDNPGMDIDEEVFLADSEDEEELEPLHIPEEPNRIIWIESVDENRIWLSVGGFDCGFIYEYRLNASNEVPYDFIPIANEDLEINGYLYNRTNQFKLFAMQNGTIRVQKLSEKYSKDFSNWWQLAMHDNLNGIITRMLFNYRETYFFTCGHDGNLFVYRFNYTNEEVLPEIQIIRRTSPKDWPITVDSMITPELSLEEEIVKKEDDRVAAVANRHKEQYREKLAILMERFVTVWQRDQQLPITQKLTANELELDSRISTYIDRVLDEKLKLVETKLEYEVEKSRVRLDKLKRHLIEPLDFYPICVKGVNRDVEVRMMKHRALTEEFQQLCRLVEEKIAAEAAKTKPVERPPALPRPKYERRRTDHELEYFLERLPSNTESAKLGPKLARLLVKFRARQRKWEEREAQWQEFNYGKPEKTGYPIDDLNCIKYAEQTIGDYKLKTSPNYKVTKGNQETTVKKYNELLIARKKQFDLRHNFNRTLFGLRDRKLQLEHDLHDLEQELSDIHQEIAQNQRKSSPIQWKKFWSEDEEFSDRHLNVNINENTSTSKLDQSCSKNGNPLDYETTQEPTNDQLERELLSINCKKHSSHNPLQKQLTEWTLNELLKYGQSDEEDTQWERDLRQKRLRTILYRQDVILYEIDEKCVSFNQAVADLNREKLQVHVAAKYLDLHIVVLHQELVILKDFEEMEEILQEKVDKKQMEADEIEYGVEQRTHRITEHNQNIEGGHNQEKAIEERFNKVIMQTKFADFLRKVFKKKFRPPKVQHDSDSSSESSSSSSSEDETNAGDGDSVDSRDFAFIKQDLNVCPKGCDPQLYDLVVALRTQRHKVQETIRDDQRSIEILLKEIDWQNRRLRNIRQIVNTNIDELERYQREKQRKLNEVLCTVVLKLNQMQNIRDNAIVNVEDCLVFSLPTLKRLYCRVDDLQTDIAHQNDIHKVSRRHLTRMRTDLEHMRKDMLSEKRNVIEMMEKKFGKVVNLLELEEAILKRTFGSDAVHDLEEMALKRIVHELQMAAVDVRSMYAEELRKWRQNVVTTQRTLMSKLNENTSKLELLALLNKERSHLGDLVKNQPHRRDYLSKVETAASNLNSELSHLYAVIRQQNEQITSLQSAKEMLETKGFVRPQLEFPKARGDDEKTKGRQSSGSEDFDVEPPGLSQQDLERLAEIEKRMKMECCAEEQWWDFGSTGSTPTIDVIAAEILKDMLDQLDVELTNRSTENFIREVVDVLLTSGSCHDLINDLIRNLPIELDEQNLRVIESTAEQLYALQLEIMQGSEHNHTSALEIVEGIKRYLLDQLPISSSEEG